uniref:uncharacterized protein LOC113474052 n=1 Tax=Ciona intestinalis TaxID=7719 RepID=UPI000EF52F3D|nr:uncharacterized protein LOC113474052 [Ciona intestinalis]|eukprot:XP_026694448.1 uncharacterized protein LOC113474052 [Ciona intestinalis]
MIGTEPEAAVVLYELAKIYENKPDYKMLNMTRSAALYNAAIVRDPKNQIFRDELKALCSAVLVEADAAKLDADLISLASEVKEELDNLREDFGTRYTQLEEISYGLEDDQLINLQKKKILNVIKLQQEVTRRYTELMRFISDECIEIMGAPPCKYAVVGLGSLARSEITLYSDFEHIIVLDNDDAKMKDQEMIMKYFRWFTTIFNIILINLGETMINCVAIPSINPRYRDWFTDIVTPNGVTFDGMAPHACIRPLGRPATKNKPWNTEFIKPVDEMVLYLDSDEQVKQGYHVAEVLSKACFVAGDEAICAEYQEKAYRRIKEHDKENGFSIVYKRMEEILKIFNFINLLFNTQLGLQNFNIKRAIYRGATLFISYIGRLHSLQASSCFDVIDELEKGKCSKEAAHQFRFMVAVTCEVRAKLYHLKGQQDDVFMEDSRFEDLTPGLIKIVGKQSLVSLLETIMIVQGLKIPDNDKWQSEMIILGKDVRHTVLALYTLHLHEDLVELMKQIVSSSQADRFLFPVQAVEVAFKSKEYDLIIKICSNLNQSKLTVNQKFEYKVYELASIVNRSYNEETKSYEGSRSVVETKIQELEEVMETVEPESINTNLILKTYFDSSKVAETNEPSISWVYTVKTYSDTLMLLKDGKVLNNSSIHAVWEQVLNLMCHDTSDTVKIETLCVYAEFLMKNDQYTEAFNILDQAKQTLQPYKNTTTYMHMHLYNIYMVCYYNTANIIEALICWLEFARICKNLKRPIPDDNKQAIKYTFHQFIFD